jgi:putative glutamine amidotransferase
MQAMMTMTPPVIGLPCCRWWLKDSQFFHLVGEKYLRAATWCGATPILLPALGDDAPLAHWLEMVDGLLFTGSPSNIEPHHYGEAPRDGDFNDPQRDATTLPLIRAALDAGVPVLGICRGLQEMNVALGGSLHPAVHTLPNMLNHREQGDTLETQYGLAHALTLAEGGVLHRALGSTQAEVNSLHGQGIRQLGAGLVAEAWAPDGLIEAFRVADAATFAVAVQWHPEWQIDAHPLSRALFQAFGEACRQRRHARG